MTKSTALFALMFLFGLTACDIKKEDKISNENPESQPIPDISDGDSYARPIPSITNGITDQQNSKDKPWQVKVEMPKVNYPAAIIFEGGKGDPWFDDTNANHTPLWRLYICLEKTSQKQGGQATLDLAQLGTAIERNWKIENTNETLFSERLSKIILNFYYQTELSDDPANNYGYAFGKAEVEFESTQSWEQIYLAPGRSYTHNLFDDDNIFNFKTNMGSLVKFETSNFRINDEAFYISSRLARFAYSEKDNYSNVIEVCEEAGQQLVMQVGNEITPVP